MRSKDNNPQTCKAIVAVLVSSGYIFQRVNLQPLISREKKLRGFEEAWGQKKRQLGYMKVLKEREIKEKKKKMTFKACCDEL